MVLHDGFSQNADMNFVFRGSRVKLPIMPTDFSHICDDNSLPLTVVPTTECSIKISQEVCISMFLLGQGSFVHGHYFIFKNYQGKLIIFYEEKTPCWLCVHFLSIYTNFWSEKLLFTVFVGLYDVPSTLNTWCILVCKYQTSFSGVTNHTLHYRILPGVNFITS